MVVVNGRMLLEAFLVGSKQFQCSLYLNTLTIIRTGSGNLQFV